MIISNELLPLIERIKTESRYLRGFHHYLSNGRCYREIAPPALFTTGRHIVYYQFIEEIAREYIEQFREQDDIIILGEEDPAPEWVFDKYRFKTSLDQRLPLDDFFAWCGEELEEELPDYTLDQFFMVSGLVFEEEYDVVYHFAAEYTIVGDDLSSLILPKIGLNKSKHVS